MISLMEAQAVKKLNASMPRTGRAIYKLLVKHWNFKLVELHNQNYQNKTYTNKSK